MAELETEGEIPRQEVARFLRDLAHEIANDDPAHGREDYGDRRRVTLIIGGDSATVTMPETVEFDVEIGSRSPMLGSGVHQELELDLSWEVENLEDHDEESIKIE